MNQIQAYCKERFENLQNSLNSKEQILNKQSIDIEVLKTNLAHLTKSLNALSNALWGMAGALMLSLFSFFVWYVQTH